MKRQNEGEVRRRRVKLKSLDAKRRKFLEAFYADALPADLLKSEQEQISAEIDAVEAALARAEGDVEQLADMFKRTLDAARNMAKVYAEAGGTDRRLWNQALFDCFRVYPDEEIEGELREEVRLLTDARTPGRLRADCRRSVSSGRGWNKSYSAVRAGRRRRSTTARCGAGAISTSAPSAA